jgi:hypothetical protein
MRAYDIAGALVSSLHLELDYGLELERVRHVDGLRPAGGGAAGRVGTGWRTRRHEGGPVGGWGAGR